MVRGQLAARGIRDQATLMAMSNVPRELFVPADMRDRAYVDAALSIGRGQTISQPYMVAVMTAALRVAELGWPWSGSPPSMLDVGTGSGYQAAVLAEIGGKVTSVERDPVLAAAARERLEQLGYDIKVVVGDGTLGYEEDSPYAAIIVAAGAPSVPPPLVDQLADGGRLVVPVGPRGFQRLTIIRRTGSRIDTSTSDACVFVPLVGTYGYPD